MSKRSDYARWRALPDVGAVQFYECEVDGGYVSVGDVKVTIEFTDNRGARVEFTGTAPGASIKTLNTYTQRVHEGVQTTTAECTAFGMAEFLSDDCEWRYVCE